MSALRRLVPSITAFALLTPAAISQAQSPATGPLLWATVNTCDTPDLPDTIGVRGSMPGSGDRHERMYMRFGLEYLADGDDTWAALGADGDSGWIAVGSARSRNRQAGRNFTVVPPPTGAFHLRATVRFEWRRGSHVVARATRRTSAGHSPTAGSDPPGFSAATCDVEAP